MVSQVEEFIAQCGLYEDKSKINGFGSDGAAVMVGLKGGVTTLLKSRVGTYDALKSVYLLSFHVCIKFSKLCFITMIQAI